MKHFSILWLRNRGRCRVLPAVATSCAIFLWCLATSAQSPYALAQSQGLSGPAIDPQSQALTFSMPVVGTPFQLTYRSDIALPKWRLNVYHTYDPAAGILSLGDGRPRRASPLLDQPKKALSWLSVGEVAIVAQDRSELYIFNEQGKHLRTLNAFTGAPVYRFPHNAAGDLETIEDAYSNITRIERDGNNFMTAIAAPLGQRTIFSDDAKGYPTRITNPAGEIISLSYSDSGQLVGLTDPRGGVYQFTTDDLGHVTQVKDPAGGSVNLGLISTAHGFKLNRNSALGRASSLLLERPSESEATLVATDPSGSDILLQSRTDGSTNITYPDSMIVRRNEQPDPRWGQHSALLKTLSLTTPGGLTSALSVNRVVKLADSTDPLSLTTMMDTIRINGQNYTRTFDATKKQVTWLSPAGRRIITSLDNYRRVVKLELPGLLSIEFTYDNRGRLTTVTQGTGPEARLASLEYNPQGQVADVTDSLKRTVRFEHDSAGRVSKRIVPDGREISFKYDADGNVASITPPRRPTHSFDYTPANLITTYQPPDADHTPRTPGVLAKLWALIKFSCLPKHARNVQLSWPYSGERACGKRADCTEE